MLKPDCLADAGVWSGNIEAVPFDELATLRPVMTFSDRRVACKAHHALENAT